MTALLDGPVPPNEPEDLPRLRAVHGPALGRLALRSLDDAPLDPATLRCGEQVTGLIDIADRKHFVRLTEAARPGAGGNHTVVMLPGWTEMVDRGSGRNLHDALSRHYPGSRIVSIATDGVGTHCRPLSWREGIGLSFDTMAADRLRIASLFADDGPVSFVNISMGSVIALKMARLNIRQPQLRLERLMNHSSAYVPPLLVPRDMVLRFFPHMLKDGLKEGVRHPREACDSALGFAGLVWRQAPAYFGNVKNLVQGTDFRDLHEVAAHEIPMGFVIGENDPLGQLKRLEKVRAGYPHLIRILRLRNRGHASSLDARRAARDIASLDPRAVSSSL